MNKKTKQKHIRCVKERAQEPERAHPPPPEGPQMATVPRGIKGSGCVTLTQANLKKKTKKKNQ